MIYYLVYLSSSTHLFSANELEEILYISRTNNTSLDITGILLYHEGSILQVLEGDESVVKNLYLKIEADDRHKNVVQMVSGTNRERSFPDWSMGFKTVTNSEWQEYESYLQLNSSLLLSIIQKKNARVDTTLKTFINNSIRS